jgi:hypothetical protein
VAPGIQHEPHALIGRLVGRVEQERAGHAQVHEEEDVVLELPDEVLAPPPEALHAASRDGVDDRGRVEGQAPPWIVNTQLGEEQAVDHGRQPAADRLDLGQLGHRLGA